MVFSSLSFLFLFLPLFLGCYYTLPHRYRSPLILIASLIFYGWWRIDFAFLFLAIMLFNYGMAGFIIRYKSKKYLISGIVINLIILGIFKYLNFGIDTLNELLGQNITALNLILPIGISFYIFHCISFLVDMYKCEAEPPRNFCDFAAFTSMFPHLVAGPVLKYKDMAPQFAKSGYSAELFSHGCYRFMSGFAKKVLIADSIAPLADSVYSLSDPTMAESWLGTIAYAMQLYFDFSGYSDMAVGLAMMMGFRFIENFNHPYSARSISEFWQRWHISLSTWLRDYVYIPLGGNRNGHTRTYINLFLVMALCGLWHGAAWTFVLWGAFHGIVMVFERLTKQEYASVPLTLFFVLLGWVLFRSADISQALQIYQSMFSFQNFIISDMLAWQIRGLSVVALVIAISLVFSVPHYEKITGKKLREAPSLALQILVVCFFLLSIVKLTAENYSPFLYFQF